MINQWMELRQVRSFFIKLSTCISNILAIWSTKVQRLIEIPGFILSVIKQNGGSLEEAFPQIEEFRYEAIGTSIFQLGIWHSGVVCTQLYSNAEAQVIERTREMYAGRMYEIEKKIRDLQSKYPLTGSQRGGDTGSRYNELDLDSTTHIITNRKALEDSLEMLFTTDVKKGVLDRAIAGDIVEGGSGSNVKGLLEVELGENQHFIVEMIKTDKNIVVKTMDIDIVDFLTAPENDNEKLIPNAVYLFVKKPLYVVPAPILTEMLIKTKAEVEKKIRTNPLTVHDASFKHMTKEIDAIERCILDNKSFTASLPLIQWPSELERVIDLLNNYGKHLKFVINPENDLAPHLDQMSLPFNMEGMMKNLMEFDEIYSKMESLYKENEGVRADELADHYYERIKRSVECDTNRSGVLVFSVADYVDLENRDNDVANLIDLEPIGSEKSEEFSVDAEEYVLKDIPECDEYDAEEGDGEEEIIDPNMQCNKMTLDEFVNLSRELLESTYEPIQNRRDMDPEQIRMMNKDKDEFGTEKSATVAVMHQIDEVLKDHDATQSVPDDIRLTLSNGQIVPIRTFHPMRISFAAYSVIKEAYENIHKHDLHYDFRRRACNRCNFEGIKYGAPRVAENYCKVMNSLTSADVFKFWFVDSDDSCVYCRVLAMLCFMIIELVIRPAADFEITRYDVIMERKTREQIRNRYLTPFAECPFIPIGRLFIDSVRFYCNISHTILLQLRSIKSAPSDIQCHPVHKLTGEPAIRARARIDPEFTAEYLPANAQYLVILEFPQDRYFDVVETTHVLLNFFMPILEGPRLKDYPDEPPFIVPCVLPGVHDKVCAIALDSRMLHTIQESMTPLIMTYAKHQPYCLLQCPYYPLAVRNYYLGDRNALYFTMAWLRRMLFTGKKVITWNQEELNKMFTNAERKRKSNNLLADQMFSTEDANNYRILHAFIACLSSLEIIAELTAPFRNKEQFIPKENLSKKRPRFDSDEYSNKIGCLDLSYPSIYAALRAFLHPLGSSYKFTREAMNSVSRVMSLNRELWHDYPIVAEILIFSLKIPEYEKNQEILKNLKTLLEDGDLWNVNVCQRFYQFHGVYAWYAWRLVQKERISQCIALHRRISNEEAWNSIRKLHKKRRNWTPRTNEGEIIADTGYIADEPGSWCICEHCIRLSNGAHINDPCPWPADTGRTIIDFEFEISARNRQYEPKVDHYVRVGRYSRVYPEHEMPLHYEIFRMAADPRVPLEIRKTIFLGCAVDTKEKSCMMPSSNSPIANIFSLSTGADETNKYMMKRFMADEFEPSVEAWYPFKYEIPEQLKTNLDDASLAACYEVTRVHNPEVLATLLDNNILTKEQLAPLIEKGLILDPSTPRPKINQKFDRIELRESRFEQIKKETDKQIKHWNDDIFLRNRLIAEYNTISKEHLDPTTISMYFNEETGKIKPLRLITKPFTLETAMQDELSYVTRLTFFFSAIESMSYFNHLTPKYEDGEFQQRPIEQEDSFNLKTTSRAYFTEDMIRQTHGVYDDVSLAMSKLDLPIAFGTFKHTEDDEDEKCNAYSFLSRQIFPLWQSRLQEPYTASPTYGKFNSASARINPMASADKEAIAMVIANPIASVDQSILLKYAAQLINSTTSFNTSS